MTGHPPGQRVAILISGTGSNMQALLRAAATPGYPAQIVLVASDNPDAGGIERAKALGAQTGILARGAFTSKGAFEEQLHGVLREYKVDLICLAGFMRILSAQFVDRWQGRIINIHPSLLPAFPGLDTHSRALAAGCKIHGATVHIVTAKLDCGPILVQGALRVSPGDNAQTLGRRVRAIEHRIFPEALRLWAAGHTGGPAGSADPRLVHTDEMLLSPQPTGDTPNVAPG